MTEKCSSYASGTFHSADYVFINSDAVSRPQLELHEVKENGDTQTDRQSDALTVKKHFFTNAGQV